MVLLQYTQKLFGIFKNYVKTLYQRNFLTSELMYATRQSLLWHNIDPQSRLAATTIFTHVVRPYVRFNFSKSSNTKQIKWK